VKIQKTVLDQTILSALAGLAHEGELLFWHYHPEYRLWFMLEATNGMHVTWDLCISSYMEKFRACLGTDPDPNVPHLLRLKELRQATGK